MGETVAQLKINVSAAVTVNEGAIRALKTVEIVVGEAKDLSEVKKYVREAIELMEKEPAQQPAPIEPPPTAAQQPAEPKAEPKAEPPPHATHRMEAKTGAATENKKR